MTMGDEPLGPEETAGPESRARDRGALRIVNASEEAARRRAWIQDLAKRREPNADPFPVLTDLADVAGTWLAELSWTRRGKPGDDPTYTPASTLSNAITIFARDPRWGGVLHYNQLAECIFTSRPAPWHPNDGKGAELGEWTEDDNTRAEAWLERAYGLKIGDRKVLHAVSVAARGSSVHPVRNYLNALEWDGVHRLDTWLSDRLEVADSVYTRAAGRCFLIGGVARAMQPGCKLDTMLILEGDQGHRKSTALRVLFGDWFVAIGAKLDPERTPQLLRGKWGAEFGELASFRKAGRYEMIKEFASRETDTYRPPYGRISRDFPRHCVFAGTTNEERYLGDPTGLRRWWPVECRRRINIRSLQIERDQLWAEAVVAYRKGEAWHFEDPDVIDAAQVEQDARYEDDAWTQPIADWIESKMMIGVSSEEILTQCLGIDIGKWSHADLSRVGAVLRRLKWRPKGRHRPRRYFPPETYA